MTQTPSMPMLMKSLGSQLSWRVGGIQILTFMLSLATLMALTWTPAVFSVPTQLAETIARASSVESGQLVVRKDALPAALLTGQTDAWLIVRGPSSQEVVFGTVPSNLAGLAARLEELEETQIRSNKSQLAAAVAVDRRSEGVYRVMVGGIPQQGVGETLLIVGKFIFLPMFLPVVLVSCLIIPWVIRRRLRGIRRLADQAETIDLDQRGTALQFADLPEEVRPLVRSFNAALTRIWEASATRDRFLADAAHELRMPMAVLRARLSSLPHSKEKLRLVNDLSRLETIAEQLLDLQRLNSPNERFQIVDLVSLCESLAAEVAPMIVEHGYEFSFEAPDTDVPILGDAGALERMFKNLLQNAMVHGGQRGPITLEVLPTAHVRVSDSGPGVPQEERNRIFSPFYRLNKSASGSGLGLHLASEVATKHGGRIRVTDSPSGGASFEVTFPSTAKSTVSSPRQGTSA